MTSFIYDSADWDNYAASHLRITSRFQHELYQACADLMQGEVVDCGCGSGKIAPYLCKNSNVTAFTGIDSSEQMITAASWLLDKLRCPNFKVALGLIEDFVGEGFNAGLSINSFYAWRNPQKTLGCIYKLLAPNSTFVLASTNSTIDMPALLQEAQKELIAHPDFAGFSEQNLAFVNNAHAHFVDIDDLVEQVRSVGFKILECHSHFYLGGINFLHLRKSN